LIYPSTLAPKQCVIVLITASASASGLNISCILSGTAHFAPVSPSDGADDYSARYPQVCSSNSWQSVTCRSGCGSGNQTKELLQYKHSLRKTIICLTMSGEKLV